MKKITLEKVALSLERMGPRVVVDPVIAAQARGAIDRMLAIIPSTATPVTSAA